MGAVCVAMGGRIVFLRCIRFRCLWPGSHGHDDAYGLGVIRSKTRSDVGLLACKEEPIQFGIRTSV